MEPFVWMYRIYVYRMKSFIVSLQHSSQIQKSFSRFLSQSLLHTVVFPHGLKLALFFSSYCNDSANCECRSFSLGCTAALLGCCWLNYSEILAQTLTRCPSVVACSNLLDQILDIQYKHCDRVGPVHKWITDVYFNYRVGWWWVSTSVHHIVPAWNVLTTIWLIVLM